MLKQIYSSALNLPASHFVSIKS